MLYLTTLAKLVPQKIDPDYEGFQKEITTILENNVTFDKLTMIDIESVIGQFLRVKEPKIEAC